jgi:hypothetical protein
MAFNVLTATATELEDLLNSSTLTREVIATEYLKHIGKLNGYLYGVIAMHLRTGYLRGLGISTSTR